MKNLKKPSLTEISGVPYSEIGGEELLVDEQLGDLNNGLTPYKLILKDAQITACYQQRFYALIKGEIEVVAGADDEESRKATDFLKKQLKKINFDDISLKMCFGRHYGFAISEVIYEVQGEYVGVKDILVRDQSRFQITKKGLFLTGENKKKMPDEKFWRYVCGAHHHDALQGLGLAYQLYWPAWFKKHAGKYWAVYIEKFATPTTHATYGLNATESEKRISLEAAQAITHNAAIATPESMNIKLIEAMRRSGGDYDKFLNYWDSAIAKIILSQEGTTKIGQYAGTGKVHSRVAKDIIAADNDLLNSSFQPVINYLTALNFPKATPPKITRNLQTTEEKKQQIEQDEKLFAMGYRRTEESFKRIYGDDWLDIKANDENANFSEPEPKKNDRPPLSYTDTEKLSEKLKNEALPYQEEMLSKIEAVINNKDIKDLETLNQELAKLNIEIEDDQFNMLLSEALQFAFLQGAKDEDQ